MQANNSGRPSPFAHAQGSSKQGQPAEPLPPHMNLQNIASMFNSSLPLTTADLQKYQSAGLNLANFPSLPAVQLPLIIADRTFTN